MRLRQVHRNCMTVHDQEVCDPLGHGGAVDTVLYLLELKT
jgi:hypothetical protein